MMVDAPNQSKNSTPNLASPFSPPNQPQRRDTSVATMARQYEFFVTTTKPHLPNGAERGMIRRLVMRNFFDTKITAPQADIPEQSSATTVMARNQLSSRFRVQRSKNDNATKGGKLVSKNGKGKTKGKRRSSPIGTTEAHLMNQITGKGYFTAKDAKGRSREGTVESILKIPKLRIDPSAHRIDPFDILPIPGTPHFDMLFQLCTCDLEEDLLPEGTHIEVSLLC